MSEPEDNNTYLICVPLDRVPPAERVPGSTEEPCHTCQVLVSVSPASREQAGPEAKYLCVDCAKKLDPAMLAAYLHPPSDGVLKELMGKVDGLIDFLENLGDMEPAAYAVQCGYCGEISDQMAPVLERAEQWMMDHARTHHPDKVEETREVLKQRPYPAWLPTPHPPNME